MLLASLTVTVRLRSKEDFAQRRTQACQRNSSLRSRLRVSGLTCRSVGTAVFRSHTSLEAIDSFKADRWRTRMFPSRCVSCLWLDPHFLLTGAVFIPLYLSRATDKRCADLNAARSLTRLCAAHFMQANLPGKAKLARASWAGGEIKVRYVCYICLFLKN